jgi:glycosyltransferase involved in cell wall biosynthesis
VTRAVVLCSGRLRGFDGVADYSHALTEHLSRHVPAALVLRASEADADRTVTAASAGPPVYTLASWRDLWRTRARPPWGEADAWLVQYVPQQFVGRGDLLALLAWLARIRLSRRGRVVLTVHEYNVPLAPTFRRIVSRLALDVLFLIIGALASQVIVTHELNRRKVSRLLFWKSRDRLALIPVGSTVRDVHGESPGSGPDHRPAPPAFTIFGQPEAMSPAIVSALGAWRSGDRSTAHLLWIGRSRQAILDFWTIRCGLSADLVDIHAGLSNEDVSRLLHQSDVSLAPIVDGVSTRRTTVMAALCHGLPVIGTDGACTDDVFRRSEACLLSAPSDAPAFLRHVQALLADPGRRSHMRRAARALYERHFTWDAIARAYVAQASGGVGETRP